MSGSRIWIGAALILAAGIGLAFAGWLLRDLFRPQTVEPAAAIKVLVEREGMVALTTADLRQFGWDNPDPESLRMEHAGEPYPLLVEGAGRSLRLVFYGRPPEGEAARYTPSNAYFLYQDGDTARTQRAETAAAAAQNGADSVPYTLRLEENHLYSPKLEEGRPWFWFMLPAPGEQTVDFTIENLAPGPASVTFQWFGSTSSGEIDPDHHLRIHLNDQLIADETWDGAGPHTITAELPEGLLREGDNRLRIEAPGDTGVAADIVLLDSIEITYPIHTDRLTRSKAFLAPTDSVRLPAGTRLYHPGPSGDQLFVQDAGPDFSATPGERYFAVPDDGYAPPAALLPAETLPDLRQSPGADYVAIGAPELLAPLQPLLAQREAQGLATIAVPVRTIYDQFGSGLATPEAIRTFLQFADANWETSPRYVLLVGDWSYDPYGHISERIENGLPSFLVFTEFGGETVSDVEIAMLDGDGWPDVALGRFPARTAEQVEVLVGKTLRYENDLPAGEWTDRVLAIADGTERSFKLDAENYLAGFDETYTPILISPDAGAGEAVSDEIRSRLQEGVLLMSYFGHGSISQIGKDALFTAAQAAALENGRQVPIMVNITCLVGLFTHPTVDSLSEAMLLNPDGGAVASLGATSLTLPVFQAYLSEAFVTELVALPDARLGDVLLAAQRDVPYDLGPGAEEVLDTFLLFGDPALVLP